MLAPSDCWYILTDTSTGKGKHYCAGKLLKSPDAGGDTIEQEIVAGGKLGAVFVINANNEIPD
jgi:hypothetical protein